MALPVNALTPAVANPLKVPDIGVCGAATPMLVGTSESAPGAAERQTSGPPVMLTCGESNDRSRFAYDGTLTVIVTGGPKSRLESTNRLALPNARLTCASARPAKAASLPE